MRSGPISMVAAPNPGSDTQIGYAIGKSVGGAVERNRIRRRVRAVLHDADRDALLPPGRYLVTCQPASKQLTHSELVSHVHVVLDRVRDAQ